MKKLTTYLIVIALLLGLLVYAAMAQQPPMSEAEDWGPITPEDVQTPVATEPSEVMIQGLELRGADITEALRLLRLATGFSFSLHPTVTGRVTVSLDNVPFTNALRAILDQVGATYRREGDLYVIMPAGDVPPPGPGDMTVIEEPRSLKVLEVRFLNAAEIAALFGGMSSGAVGYAGSFSSGGGTGYRSSGTRGTGTGVRNTGTNSGRTSGGVGRTSGGFGSGSGGGFGGGFGGGSGGGPGGGFGGGSGGRGGRGF